MAARPCINCGHVHSNDPSKITWKCDVCDCKSYDSGPVAADLDVPFDPDGDDDCPNPDCFRGQVDDVTKPKLCPCCSYEMKDCPTCNGTGTFPRTVEEIG